MITPITPDEAKDLLTQTLHDPLPAKTVFEFLPSRLSTRSDETTPLSGLNGPQL